MIRVAELSDGDACQQIDRLSALLIDAVENGASVSFMAAVTRAEADALWEATIARIADGRTLLFAAFAASDLIGTVLLHPPWQPNQPHRADVAKLLVCSRSRRQSVATLLMNTLEVRAAELGRMLLTLDTGAGSSGEPFYRKRAYVFAGIIPG